MSAVLSLFRSHLLRPVFIALGIALLVQVLVAVALTRSTVTELEADLATRLGVDSQHLSSELEQASHEVTSSLDRLSQNTRQRLSAGLSSRLKDEQVQLRATLEADLKDSATDMAELLAAVAPRAMWDGDTPTLSEFARRAQRNPKEGLEVLRDSARLQKKRAGIGRAGSCSHRVGDTCRRAPGAGCAGGEDARGGDSCSGGKGRASGGGNNGQR